MAFGQILGWAGLNLILSFANETKQPNKHENRLSRFPSMTNKQHECNANKRHTLPLKAKE
jgi:hypothetical protein